MTERKQPGMAFWASVVMVGLLVVAYPLSVGPAEWLDDRGHLPSWAEKPVAVIYAPLNWIVQHSDAARTAAKWYIGLWVDLSDDAGSRGLPVARTAIANPAFSLVPATQESWLFLRGWREGLQRLFTRIAAVR